LAYRATKRGNKEEYREIGVIGERIAMRLQGLGPNGYTLCILGHEKTPENLSKYGKCRLCAIAKSKEYYVLNKSKVLELAKQQYYTDKEKFVEKGRKYREANKDKLRESKKLYYIENKEKRSETHRKWRESNREALSIKRKQYYEENKEAISEYRKQFQIENKEILSERKKQYTRENKEKVAETNKRSGAKWRAKSKDKITASRKKYYKDNPMVFRLQNHKRSALKKKVGGALSKNIADKLLVLQKGKCRVCKTRLADNKFHLDHIMPMSKGGTAREMAGINPVASSGSETKL
jgi:hypothetical protein